ncbi:unnamed protein product [Trichobilharzia szidati]|nr:unnamed protein product [Trichobilharzia szidati]
MDFETKRSVSLPKVIDQMTDKRKNGNIQIYREISNNNNNNDKIEIHSSTDRQSRPVDIKSGTQEKYISSQSLGGERIITVSTRNLEAPRISRQSSAPERETSLKFTSINTNIMPITLSSSPSHETTHELLSHHESISSSVDKNEDVKQLDQKDVADTEERLERIRSHLNYLHKHETEHLRILEDIIKSLECIRNKRSSIEVKEIRSSLHSIETIQKKFIHGLKNCLQNGDVKYPYFTDPFKLLIGRQIEISNYVNGISKVLKNSKCEKLGSSPTSFRLQEPMTWITQTVENIKSLMLLLHEDSPHYPDLQRICKRLLEESLTSNESHEEVTANDSDRLIMCSLVVELENKSNNRKLRYLFLFKDALVCAKPKLPNSIRKKLPLDDPAQSESRFRRKRSGSGQELEIKWFIYTEDISLLTNSRFGNDDRGRLQQQRNLDELKDMVRNLRQTVIHNSEDRRPSKNTSKLTNLSKLEGKLVLETPQLILPIADKNGRVHNILLSTERERAHWRTAMEQQSENKSSVRTESVDNALEKVNTENPQASNRNRNPTLTELNERLKKYEHTVTLNKAGLALLGNDEPITGFVNATVHGIDGLEEKNSYHVCIEVDSYGQCEEVARTKVLQQANPQWEQSFDLEVDGAWTICFTLYIHQEILAELEVPLDLETLKQNSMTAMKILTNENPPRDLVFTISLKYIDKINLNKNRRSEIPGNLFGRHLTELIKVSSDRNNQNNTIKHKSEAFIPRLVTACVEEIERRGLLEVGVYRICGSNDDVKALKNEFDESCTLAIQRLSLVQLPVITSLLKQFFQQLPESLINFSATKALVQAVEIEDESVRYQVIHDILYDLPTTNLETFNYLAHHLITVSRYREENKMNLGNLSLIWSMTLFECAQDTPQSVASIGKGNANSTSQFSSIQIQAAYGFQQAKALNCILTAMNSGKLTIPHHDNVIRPEYS